MRQHSVPRHDHPQAPHRDAEPPAGVALGHGRSRRDNRRPRGNVATAVNHLAQPGPHRRQNASHGLALGRLEVHRHLLDDPRESRGLGQRQRVPAFVHRVLNHRCDELLNQRRHEVPVAVIRSRVIALHHPVVEQIRVPSHGIDRGCRRGPRRGPGLRVEGRPGKKLEPGKRREELGDRLGHVRILVRPREPSFPLLGSGLDGRDGGKVRARVTHHLRRSLGRVFQALVKQFNLDGILRVVLFSKIFHAQLLLAAASADGGALLRSLPLGQVEVAAELVEIWPERVEPRGDRPLGRRRSCRDRFSLRGAAHERRLRSFHPSLRLRRLIAQVALGFTLGRQPPVLVEPLRVLFELVDDRSLLPQALAQVAKVIPHLLHVLVPLARRGQSLLVVLQRRFRRRERRIRARHLVLGVLSRHLQPRHAVSKRLQRGAATREHVNGGLLLDDCSRRSGAGSGAHRLAKLLVLPRGVLARIHVNVDLGTRDGDVISRGRERGAGRFALGLCSLDGCRVGDAEIVVAARARWRGHERDRFARARAAPPVRRRVVIHVFRGSRGECLLRAGELAQPLDRVLPAALFLLGVGLQGVGRAHRLLLDAVRAVSGRRLLCYLESVGAGLLVVEAQQRRGHPAVGLALSLFFGFGFLGRDDDRGCFLGSRAGVLALIFIRLLAEITALRHSERAPLQYSAPTPARPGLDPNEIGLQINRL